MSEQQLPSWSPLPRGARWCAILYRFRAQVSARGSGSDET